MFIKDFVAILGLAVAGASTIVLVVHFGLKVFKPEAFNKTKPAKIRGGTQRVEQISLYLSDAMGAYFADKVEARSVTARQRAQATFGSALAPQGQPRSSDLMVPRAAEGEQRQVSGAANAAQFGTSS